VKSIDELLRPAVIIARNDSKIRELEGLPCERSVLKGEPDPGLVVEVGALKFEVDPLHGQKTGLFLDQAENYSRLKGLTSPRRALDCFCYCGGWGLHAAHFGAEEVIGIDTSAYGIESAARNAQLNGLKNCTFREEEVFETLAYLDKAHERFDLVILDPPAFAKSRENLTEGLRAYKQINLRAMRILKPGGTLVTCSCSYRVSRQAFLDMLRRAASDASRSFRVLEYRTQSRDHPVLLSVNETEYLKCAFLRVM
jgi:23S rRNA (cytosine1962-C5)-methyltransferase